MKNAYATCVAICLTAVALPASAGVYADDLTKCLVSSTTDADKSLLMKWIFSAISLNEEVAPFVNMPSAARTKINQDAAALYMRLLTDACKKQTHDAVKYEGQPAITAAFQVLGQVASQGIFSDPAVSAGMSDMTKYMDEEKLKAVLTEK